MVAVPTPPPRVFCVFVCMFTRAHASLALKQPGLSRGLVRRQKRLETAGRPQRSGKESQCAPG